MMKNLEHLHSIPGSEIIQICKLEMVCISESDVGISLDLSCLLCKFGGEMRQKEMANVKQTTLDGFWNQRMSQWSHNMSHISLRILLILHREMACATGMHYEQVYCNGDWKSCC